MLHLRLIEPHCAKAFSFMWNFDNKKEGVGFQLISAESNYLGSHDDVIRLKSIKKSEKIWHDLQNFIGWGAWTRLFFKAALILSDLKRESESAREWESDSVIERD